MPLISTFKIVYLSNSSGVTSRKGCREAHAALLTSRSIGPTTSSRNAASVASQSARSTHTGLMDGHCGGGGGRENSGGKDDSALFSTMSGIILHTKIAETDEESQTNK